MSLIGDEVLRDRIAACLRAICAAKYEREDNVPCQIEQGLFMGSVGAALNRDALKRMNITHVLIVAKSLDPAFPNDFIYKKIEVLDTADTNLSEHFDECFDFIDEAKRDGGGVLVHCFAGKSRSGTIVVAYLMKQHRMSLSEALELVRSKRPQVQPNYGFMIQLQNFEKSLKGHGAWSEWMSPVTDQSGAAVAWISCRLSGAPSFQTPFVPLEFSLSKLCHKPTLGERLKFNVCTYNGAVHYFKTSILQFPFARLALSELQGCCLVVMQQ